MCIIIYKPKLKTIKIEKIKEQATFNNDGFGFSYLIKNSWNYKKYSADEFDIFINNIKQYLTGEYETIIHLRLATSGVTTAINSHPFDLTNLFATEGNSKYLLFHNGVEPSLAINKQFSDTFFVAVLISGLIKLNLFDAIDDALLKLKGKYLLTMGKQVKMYGYFYEENGIYYSQPQYNKYFIYKWRKNDELNIL